MTIGGWDMVCFLFGHRDAPESIAPQLERAVGEHYRHYGLRTFIVGHYGDFDRLSRAALLRVKRVYPDMRLYMLIPYHPAERPVEAPEGFDGTCYPPIEGIPRKYAIAHANRYLAQRASHIICYVRRCGNARNLLELAEKRNIPVVNLAE